MDTRNITVGNLKLNEFRNRFNQLFRIIVVASMYLCVCFCVCKGGEVLCELRSGLVVNVLCSQMRSQEFKFSARQ